MSRGIVLIALGHPNYGELAANLAISLRNNDSTMPIHLIYSDGVLKELSEAHKSLFTNLELVPESCITKNGKINYLKAKTFVYDLSPFHETIFIDVDTMWLQSKSIEQLFNELSDIDFTMQNRGVIDLENPVEKKEKYLWASIHDVQKKFAKGFLYYLNSEFIYFKKTDKVKSLFEKAKEYYENPTIPTTAFNGDVADEIAFGLAMIELGIYPHKINYVPVYWFLMEGNKSIDKIKDDYYAYSVGGNRTAEDIRKKYNNLMKAYAYKLGLTPFPIKQKRHYLPERNKY